MFNSSIALKNAKIRLKLTNQDLSGELEVTTATIHNWLSGKSAPAVDKIIPFLNKHGVTLEKFSAWGEE